MLCVECREPFEPHHHLCKLCSDECRRARKVRQQIGYQATDKGREVRRRYRDSEKGRDAALRARVRRGGEAYAESVLMRLDHTDKARSGREFPDDDIPTIDGGLS